MISASSILVYHDATSGPRGTLYLGVTANLVQRIWQHKNYLTAGFTRRYGVHTLACHEVHETMLSAIAREKAIKGWRRARIERGRNHGSYG